MAKELKDTLNLPKTNFPMRANLVSREPQRIEHWDKLNLYTRIQEKHQDNEPFILHDGPPFTNGDVHIGTALNKTLKDIILRYKSMRGCRTPYVPGWDCHGLPIEHKVARERQAANASMDPLEVRKACADFSASYIEKQRGQFRRLGVLADWEREYKTMNPAYEADILRTFSSFIEKDLVYRSKKPVYWSIPCETALAEAEIEYKDHTSPSIWVAFPVPADEASKAGLPENSHFVIWTTTPWTLPANLAVAVHPRLDYVAVSHQGKNYVVAAELASSFIEKCELDGATVSGPILGEKLEGIQCRHPFIERNSPVVLADYVTTESGTGCVHTAPGHGQEDYLTGLNYKLEIYCPLDDKGCYADDGQIPANLVGISVLETSKGCPANKAVLSILKENGSLLQCERYAHQYPHCWRSKTPVVFRAMDQWFVSLDKAGMRQKVLEEIGQVKWIPGWGENRIRGAVENRPDWCISRQRSWGVPIPVFYDEDGNPYIDAQVVCGIADKVETAGTNLWFEASAEEILSGIDLPANWPAPATLRKGMDTLDVWIDSGCSHRAVLKRHDDLTWPADLYLEGSDQHRGWFRSSIWTGVISEDKAPYRSILTHGFIVDQNKKKISKSDGKPQTADGYVKQYGADILRLWISSEDYRNDIPLSDGILKQIANSYRTIRNTLRFQLGNLYDFDLSQNSVAPEDMTVVDRWALYKTAELTDQVTEAFEQYEFHKVFQLINRFCTVTLSAQYHDVLKDRLYTYGVDWKERRGSQTAIAAIFDTLVKLVAPILTFTADEAWAYAQGDNDFIEDPIHVQDWPTIPGNWRDAQAHEDVEALFKFREQVNEQLEKLRQDKVLGQSLDARVEIKGRKDDTTMQLLERHREALPELFIVSQVELEEADTELTVEVKQAQGVRCPRSWRWVSEIGTR